jgi:hypothetical protein
MFFLERCMAQAAGANNAAALAVMCGAAAGPEACGLLANYDVEPKRG